MLLRFLNFVRYNNALPIGISVLLLTFSGAMAASPDAREAIFSSQSIVRSVDNTYLLNSDLEARDFRVRIVKIIEDSEKYYVDYTYNTLDVKEYVWQEIPVLKTMAVSKKELLGGDLGIFVARELSQLVDSQRSYLKEAQSIARKEGLSQKVVTTEYTGLIGRLLDPKEEVFAGYTPSKPDTDVLAAPPVSSSTHPLLSAEEVGTAASSSAAAVASGLGNITNTVPVPGAVSGEYNVLNISPGSPPPTVVDPTVLRSLVEQAVREALAANSASPAPTTSASAPASPPAPSAPSPSQTSGSSGSLSEPATSASSSLSAVTTTTPAVLPPPPPDTTPPTITLNGNNPAEIALGSSYVDLGAVVADNVDQNLGYTMIPNSVDTSTTTTVTITFTASDAAGNTASATRLVNVR